MDHVWALNGPMMAQAPIDGLLNGSGWAGAGLLGLVLAWLLMKHLPAKDAQIKELLSLKDGQIDSQRREFTESLTRLTSAFRDEAAADRAACERHISATTLLVDNLADFMHKRAKAAATRKGVIE